jgi:FtsP/CotA-like multicopper oxidase with cupredoxin domain
MTIIMYTLDKLPTLDTLDPSFVRGRAVRFLTLSTVLSLLLMPARSNTIAASESSETAVAAGTAAADVAAARAAARTIAAAAAASDANSASELKSASTSNPDSDTATADAAAAAAAAPEALPAVVTHDNRQPAGVLTHGTLVLNLRAARGLWRPEKESGPAFAIEAFGERTGVLMAPAPLIRVPEATQIVASIRNDLTVPLFVHGLCERSDRDNNDHARNHRVSGGGDRDNRDRNNRDRNNRDRNNRDGDNRDGDNRDRDNGDGNIRNGDNRDRENDATCARIVVPPGGLREVTFRSGRAGTYAYWADTLGLPQALRFGSDTQLSGAFIVDPPAAATGRQSVVAGAGAAVHTGRDAAANERAAEERIFVITEWSSLTRDQIKQASTADDPFMAALSMRPKATTLINGLSWPETERLTYRLGETVRWRIVNASPELHPLHLHGFYFEVDSVGDGQHDTQYATGQKPRVVTQLLPVGGTFALTWTPERAGKWLFHCHFMEHVSPDLHLGPDPAAASPKESPDAVDVSSGHDHAAPAAPAAPGAAAGVEADHAASRDVQHAASHATSHDANRDASHDQSDDVRHDANYDASDRAISAELEALARGVGREVPFARPREVADRVGHESHDSVGHESHAAGHGPQSDGDEHAAITTSPRSASASPETKAVSHDERKAHDAHSGYTTLAGMAGMVLGITVLGPDGTTTAVDAGAAAANLAKPLTGAIRQTVEQARQAGPRASAPLASASTSSPAPRKLTMIMRSEPNRYGTEPAYGFILSDERQPSTDDTVRAPGPQLLLRRDEPVEITLVNRLPEATAVHWHGMELDSYYDGVHGWGGDDRHATPLIAPGESFVVRFTPPRTGTFMYHTHMHDYRQLSAGLYGALLVIDPTEIYDPTTDHALVLGRAGVGPAPVMVLNGSANPQFTWRAGTRHRLRLMNITRHDIVQVSLASATGPVTWRPLTKDGAPVPSTLAAPRTAEQTIAVGETYDFEYDAPASRQDLWIEVRGLDGHWYVQGRAVVKPESLVSGVSAPN